MNAKEAIEELDMLSKVNQIMGRTLFEIAALRSFRATDGAGNKANLDIAIAKAKQAIAFGRTLSKVKPR